MNSIAIWYEVRPNMVDATVPELDIHVNHWKLRPNKSSVNNQFMDVGLMVKGGEQVRRICIYVPGEIKNKSKLVEDLGDKLKDVRILTAVFNESYLVTADDTSKDFIVSEKGQDLFKVYTLDVENDIELESKFKGTILRFPFHLSDSLPTYYRLRLKSPFVNGLSFVYKPSNSLFESVSSSIEIIDFRINDTRDLELSLIEYMRSVGKFNIALVHYFVMRSVRDEYILLEGRRPSAFACAPAYTNW